MKTTALKMALSGAILVSSLSVSAPAYAGTGCNGVVNIFVWGCAPWDNNNGAKYPYFKKREVAMRVPTGSKITIKDGYAFVTVNGRNYPVINGANGVVAAGGGNVVAAGGGNVVAAGGMNLRVWDGN